MSRPAAYLRKSKDAGSKAEHTAALEAAIHADGHNGDTVWYDDWARSGDIRKLSKRVAWRDLCEAIERGDHDVVYMNDLDRGGRSVEEWARFMRVARERGVRVVAGGTDWSAPERRMEFYLRAVFAEEELEKAKQRSAFTLRLQRRRGDAIGVPPYGFMKAREEGTGRVVHVPNPAEPVGAVVDAVREAGGNVLQATRLLNERGVSARRAAWSPKSVAKVVRRELGEREAGRLLGRLAKPRKSNRGDEVRQPALLAKLVRCHCGTVMTPRPASGGLYCYNGIKLGEAHGRYVGRARHVIDLLRRETEGQREAKWTAIHTSEPAAEDRAALEEELRRLGVAYRAGAVDDEEFQVESARLRAAVEEASAEEAMAEEALTTRVTATGPLVHWDRLETDPALVGEDLRRLVREVRLDRDLMPVEVVWR